MSVSCIIPAFNEQEWLNRTIENIFSTSSGEIEVIVVLNGYDQKVDSRAKVIKSSENVGERIAMNWAVKESTGTHILRIDAHCDFSPIGWDVMMETATGPMDMTQAVLTACRIEWDRLNDIDKARWLAKSKTPQEWIAWDRIPGHRYERCRLLPTMEAKWEKPNRIEEGKLQPMLIPNMSSTGCGMMWRREFYDLIGGASEDLPPMGAIGEEFSVKTWLAGGRVQTLTRVMIGHIFSTGAYDTVGVLRARQMLVDRYGRRYPEIRAKFPDLDWEEELKPTTEFKEHARTVTVTRSETTESKDEEGKVIMQLTERFRYVWIDDGTESHLTDQDICDKYRDRAVKVGQITAIPNDDGQMVDQVTGTLVNQLDHLHDSLEGDCIHDHTVE